MRRTPTLVALVLSAAVVAAACSSTETNSVIEPVNPTVDESTTTLDPEAPVVSGDIDEIAITSPASGSSTSAPAFTLPTLVPGITTGTAPITPITYIPQTTVKVSTTTTVAQLPPNGGNTSLHFEIGPFDIQPGQNTIDYIAPIPQPMMNGWITSFKANLRFADGTIPGVDVIHLHHGVWLNMSGKDATANLPERFFAAGEEKTTMKLPSPYGYRYRNTDVWTLNYMLHNLTPAARKVWVTYDVDIIPDTSVAAKYVIPARPIWMDVQNGNVYPVFDVLRGSGDGVTYTYPDQASNPYPGTPKNQWTVDRDGVLVATAGHLHPGGLHTDLNLQRGGNKAHLFRSDAQYFEPAGAVSWDVAMTATTPDWHVAVKKGDVLSTTATYDSGLASWYESMGIMVVWMGEPGGFADDPFATAVDKPGMLTHGHLAENDNHGGAADVHYLDLTTLPSEPAPGTINISSWLYAKGDMTSATAIPTVKPGGSLTFNNLDAPIGKGQWHTITACKAPCNKSTGIAYPIADGPVVFDSGQLGNAGPPTAGRTTWSIPTNQPAGTYTYFCRIHPIMRGAFRVEP
jgi:plastocyanin